MVKRKTKEEKIQNKVENNFNWMNEDYEKGRSLSAILSSCGFIYEEEFNIAKEYFLKLKEDNK